MVWYDDDDEPKRDYTGTLLGACIIPVWFLVANYFDTNIATSICIFLGMILLTIHFSPKQRKHRWFWIVMVVIACLHVPLIFLIKYPRFNLTLAALMPIGVMDFILIRFILYLCGKLFHNANASDDDSDGDEDT
jgi:predicted membrane channel-forming protein YqfA (hemolysin III family)